jgi:hypothetical protein
MSTFSRRSALIPGLLLILLGAYMLARNLNLPLPGADQLWPAFPVVFGVAFVLQYFLGGRRDTGLVFVGVAAALCGLFFFAFTLNRLEWADLDRWWPVFVLIGSAAFFAQWLVNPAQSGLLVPASMALIVGGVALPLTLGRASPALVEQVTKLWPLGLIIFGLGLMVSYLFRPRA